MSKDAMSRAFLAGVQYGKESGFAPVLAFEDWSKQTRECEPCHGFGCIAYAGESINCPDCGGTGRLKNV